MDYTVHGVTKSWTRLSDSHWGHRWTPHRNSPNTLGCAAGLAAANPTPVRRAHRDRRASVWRGFGLTLVRPEPSAALWWSLVETHTPELPKGPQEDNRVPGERWPGSEAAVAPSLKVAVARGAVTQTQKVPLVRILSDPAPLYSRQLAVLTNSTATPGPATRAPMHLGGDSQGAGAAFPRLWRQPSRDLDSRGRWLTPHSHWPACALSPEPPPLLQLLSGFAAPAPVQFLSAQSLSRVRLCDPRDRSTPGLCPSPTLGVHSHSCPWSRRCHPAFSSSVVLFSSRLQSFPASVSSQMSQFFTSGGQSIGGFSFSISSSNEQTGLTSFRMGCLDLLAVQGTLKSQKNQFFSAQLSLWSNSHIHTWLLEKP